MKIFIKLEIVFYIFLMLLGIGGFFFAILFPNTIGFYASVISASLGGLGVASYIFYAKRYKQHLACPTGDECNAVVNSKYGRFLGIHLEYFGMLYYLTIFISYGLFILSPTIRETALLPIVLLLTAGAFLFSLYLIFVQAFLLRKWCIWCLLSAALSTMIFVVSLVSIETAGAFLGEIYMLLEMFSALGYVLGLGGATAAVFLFVKFLDDFDINEREANTLKNLTEMIWLGLGLIFVGKYATYVAFTHELAESTTFLAEIIALSVVFLSSAVLKVLFTPFLDVLPFEENPGSPLVSLREATLLTGGVALSSWYFAFVVGFLPNMRLGAYLLLYAGVLLASLVAATLWQKRFE